MNMHIFKGQWHEIAAKLKHRWAELTEDDLSKIKADHEQIFGILQKHYGYAGDDVKKYVDKFLRQFESMQSYKEKIELCKNKISAQVQAHPIQGLSLALLLGAGLAYLFKR